MHNSSFVVVSDNASASNTSHGDTLGTSPEERHRCRGCYRIMHGVVLNNCSGFDTNPGVVLVPVSKLNPILGSENDPKTCSQKRARTEHAKKGALKMSSESKPQTWDHTICHIDPPPRTS